MFLYSIGYNRTMETNEDKCKTCGRPWKAVRQCNYCDSCLFEYSNAMPACIRNKQPDCQAKAVIPAVTTETVDNITELANCFVHVTNINTTFYIDDKHRPMITWAGAVEISDYNIATNPLKLRSQSLYTYVNNVFTEVYFDRKGVGHVIGQEAEEV